MKILSGVDLVYLPRFKKSLRNGGETFLRRVYFRADLHCYPDWILIFIKGYKLPDQILSKTKIPQVST